MKKTEVNRAKFVFEALTIEYPSARCTVNLKSPPQFLFSSILSPQCTDIVVNRVSDDLWDRFGTVEEIAKAKPEKIEEVIRPCGMYRVKTKNIQLSANMLIDEYRGEVPRTIDELMRFPGIGRKTALVIMLEVYGIVDGIIIDTHNIRIANRIGFTKETDAVKIENQLREIVPREYWRMWSHLMVFHGRELCVARNPKCERCPILEVCDYGQARS